MTPTARPTRSARLVAFSSLIALGACSLPAPTPNDLVAAPGKRVEGTKGMVAASSPEAAAAGAEILRAGGNAADAAVATAFALSVTDVSQTGLGGGGALTFYDARAKRADHLSFYPRTGSDPRWAENPGPAAQRAPGTAAAVPGMVAGLLETHRRFGRLPRAQVMAPAIRLARDGFVVTPLLSRTITSSRARLEVDPDAKRTFLPTGEPLRPGDRLVQPVLAATLERIAADGNAAFYQGDIAVRLAAKVQAQGGFITAEDMGRFPVLAGAPLCAAWHGHTVLTAPPPVGGAPVLAMLQMAEAAGLTRAGGFSSEPEAVATLAGVLRTAQADAGWWRGDPTKMAVPARGVSSAGYAKARAAELTAPVRDTVAVGDPWSHETDALPAGCTGPAYPSATRGPDSAPPTRDLEDAGSFTSHLAVVDADGNAVSATTTVGVLFGSGVYTDGFFLNSSNANMDARTRGVERYTNSTIAPTIILDRGAVRLVIGAAGSQYIQPAITQVALRILAFGEDPGRAISAPRIQTTPTRREVEVEPGFTPSVYAGLVARGYVPVSRVGDIQFGGIHGVYVRRDGLRIGIADPRRDGVAVRQ